ncbi:MAG: RecB-family nuclease [Candidatus Heimdallarchaeota archaeon]
MSSGKLVVQLHNFSSVNLCREFVKIALGVGARDIIFSKAVGAGATTGVPVAQKIAHSKQANLLYLQDLTDTIELVAPDEIYLFIKRPFSKTVFDPDKIAKSYNEGKTILLVFGGAEPGLTKKELDKGIPVYFDKINEIGCLGEITLALYLMRKIIERN